MSRRPLSLFMRLLLLAVPLEGTVMVILGASILYRIERQDWSVQRSRLAASAVALTNTLEPEERGSVEFSDQFLPLLRGYLLRVTDPSGRILFEQPPDWYERSRREAARFASGPFDVTRYDDQDFLVYRKAFNPSDEDEEGSARLQSGRYELLIGSPLAALQKRHVQLVHIAWSLGSLLLAILVFLQWLVFRFGLRPIRLLISRLVPEGPGGPNRLEPERVPRELEPVAKEINALLDRLEVQIERERRFADTAAHELRTPIAVVKSTLQSAFLPGADPGGHARAIRDALDDLDRLESTANSLLELSRWGAVGDGALAAGEAVDLQAVFVELAEDWEERAAAEGMRIEAALTPCLVHGDPVALRVLFGNLVANAVKYAGAGRTLTLGLDRQPDGVAACVADDGPCVPESEREFLFTPFQRGTRATAGRKQGSGLGLAIAAAIAGAHGAALTYAAPPAGGNLFCVRFFDKRS